MNVGKIGYTAYNFVSNISIYKIVTYNKSKLTIIV